MNKQKRTTEFFRRVGVLCAVAACCAAVVATPLDWGYVGRKAARVALTLRQPEQAAALWTQRLTQTTTQAEIPPAALAPEGDGGADREDTTALDIPTAAPMAESPPITMTDPPGNRHNGGAVVEKKMDTGNTLDTGIATVNRSGKSVDIAAALGQEIPFAWGDTDAPQVLILHTHTTEGYMTYAADYYNEGDRNRTKDHTKNVCAVGEAIKMTLAAAGITAIHDTTVHDSPVYSGAYNRSAATAREYLEQYPTIRVVLDIHRDAVMEGDTAIVKPTATVAGKKAAQMMLITGVVTTDALPHPNWQQNLTFSTRLQQALCEVSPDLMRPLNTVASRYNQHLSPGWVLVEVGSEGNTIEEAVYSGQILGRTLAALLD